MAYDLQPLHSYVRFYQAVVTQLTAAWDNLARIHGVAKEALEPFAEPLKPAESEALAAAVTQATQPPPAYTSLWKPEDSHGLTGLTDVYEVVGRFSFQGEDNQNLSRVQLLVATGRNEIVAQRFRLQELVKLPELAKKKSSALADEETSHAAERRREMIMGFDQLAEVVTYRAKQTMDAVRAVPLPDMTNIDAELGVVAGPGRPQPESAADAYRKYATKVDQVYQTCLPFLRKAISNLYTFVAAEAPSSWPDSLPLQKELPEELVRIPVADSVELQQAQASIKALADEEIQLSRMKDEITSGLSRIDSELNASMLKESEVSAEIATATGVLEYVALQEAIESLGHELKALAAQKAERVRAAGNVLEQHKQTEASITQLTEELTRRTEELSALRTQLEKEQADEPVLFGKEEWRTKVGATTARVEELGTLYSQRLAMLNQLKIEQSALSVKVQTEQAHLGIVERSAQDAVGKLDTFQKQLRDLGQRLGASRPARPIRATEAEQALVVLTERRVDAVERIERLRAEQRRLKEDGTRVLARAKQIEVERQHMRAMMQSAQTAATQGRDAALRQLAAQRRSTVEAHVTEVLGALEKSLTSVGMVFVDPAREEMMKSTEPSHKVSDSVKEHAEKLDPIVQKLGPELDAELAAQDAALAQIQKEFCDRAPDACRTAWG
ncbi:MAG: hypothetical protein IPK82_03400 [Polyangiaceae bacterium]|nr:hypothetical protein [Polyangiaceae bacterium]